MGTVKNSSIALNDEEMPEKFLGKFVFTKKTITFGHKTLQISNISKIEVNSFKETTKPTYSISENTRDSAIKAAALGLIGIFLGGVWEPFRIIGVLLILISGGIIWYYYDERQKKRDKIYNFYGLFFDCTSGKSEVLWSDDYSFVNELFDRITEAMNRDNFNGFVANFIENKFESIENSTVIKDSSNVVAHSHINANDVSIGGK